MPKKTTRGRKPARLKLAGNWQDAVSSAIKRKRPAEGWPELEKPTKKRKKKKG